MKKVAKIENIASLLIEQGIGHDMYATMNTTYLKDDDGNSYYCSEHNIKFKWLGFINKVKNFTEKCGKKKEIYTPKDINYYRFSSMASAPKGGQKVFYDVVEFDVRGAYWEIAKRLGYISPQIYKEGLTKPKKLRLLALGNIASSKIHKRYCPNEKRYLELPNVVDEITRSYFFHVAKTLDMIMSEFFDTFENEGVFFYWVDAFFVRNSLAKRVIAFFEKHGLEMKEVKLKSICVSRVELGTKVTAIVDKGGVENVVSHFQVKPYLNINKKSSRYKMEEIIKEAIELSQRGEIDEEF